MTVRPEIEGTYQVNIAIKQMEEDRSNQTYHMPVSLK